MKWYGIYIYIQYFLELCRALRRSLWFSNNSMIIHQHHSIILFDMCVCLHHIDIHLHILQDLGLRVKAVSMNLRPFTRWGRGEATIQQKNTLYSNTNALKRALLCLTRHCIYCYLHSVSLRTSRGTSNQLLRFERQCWNDCGLSDFSTTLWATTTSGDWRFGMLKFHHLHRW